MRAMRAVTLWQPWASLVAEGVKTIETRGRRSPWHTAIGETVAIHAAKRKPEMTFVGNWTLEPRWSKCAIGEPEWWAIAERHGDRMIHREHVVPFGAVVATCRLIDVVPTIDVDDVDRKTSAFVAEYPHTGDLPHQRGGLWLIGSRAAPWRGDFAGAPMRVEDQRPFGDFAPGRWALLLDEIEKLPEPIPAKGRQGLWEWEG